MKGLGGKSPAEVKKGKKVWPRVESQTIPGCSNSPKSCWNNLFRRILPLHKDMKRENWLLRKGIHTSV